MNGWPQEEIPNEDRLFLRVHRNLLSDGQIVPGIFREQHGAMSTDWERFSTAQESRARAARPTENGIVALVAGGIRNVPDLRALHEPIQSNRAHTNVYGLTEGEPQAKTERRLKLFEMFHDWELRPDGV